MWLLFSIFGIGTWEVWAQPFLPLLQASPAILRRDYEERVGCIRPLSIEQGISINFGTDVSQVKERLVRALAWWVSQVGGSWTTGSTQSRAAELEPQAMAGTEGQGHLGRERAGEVGCHPQEQGGPRAVLQRPRFPEWPFGVLIMLSDFVKVLFTWKGQIQNKPFPFPLGWHHILCQWIYRHSFWMLNSNLCKLQQWFFHAVPRNDSNCAINTWPALLRKPGTTCPWAQRFARTTWHQLPCRWMGESHVTRKCLLPSQPRGHWPEVLCQMVKLPQNKEPRSWLKSLGKLRHLPNPRRERPLRRRERAVRWSNPRLWLSSGPSGQCIDFHNATESKVCFLRKSNAIPIYADRFHFQTPLQKWSQNSSGPGFANHGWDKFGFQIDTTWLRCIVEWFWVMCCIDVFSATPAVDNCKSVCKVYSTYAYIAKPKW